MYWYAQTPARRGRQVLADVLVAVWVVGWLLAARAVHTAVSALAAPAASMRQAGDALSNRMLDVVGRVGSVPAVGDDLQAAFTGVAAAGTDLSAAGDRLESSVDRAAWWLSLLTCGTPVLLVLGLYVLARLRGIRAMNAAARDRDDPRLHQLLALRALTNARASELAAISEEPLQAWQRGDPQVIRALTALEARRHGLKPAPG
ncbi:MAG TPA: hypothetical protein VJ976_05190 [Ornithinimicrobium sp.]|uniref:hypothetical protein n=1 Tax=Ornithinimicrobium sp. TaxID=1977084 RepID=UPI002B4695B5|nr:hypothetical protein [Ornithinimicrobium sp.]HKJ11766.1 hypothetical protein [Ornithinimicrobium sp.]